MTRLLAILALLLPALAFAQAGRFLLAVGEVTVQRGGAITAAGIGTPLESGDTINVGINSNAQLRMTDESIISLRAGTIFRIDEYFYSGQSDGRERTLFSLLKGGFRTVTGAIGRLQNNRDRYAVRTPTSTIGIRGTHYVIVHCDNDCVAPTRTSSLFDNASAGQSGPPAFDPSLNGTSGGVTDGRIGVSNQRESREFGANEFFRVASPTSGIESLIGPPPHLNDRLAGQQRNQGQKGQATSETMGGSGLNAESRPSDTPTPPAPSTFVVTEQKSSTGEPTIVAATPDTAAIAAWISGGFNDLTAGGALVSQSALTIGSGGVLQGFKIPPSCVGPNEECANPPFATLGAPAESGSATFTDSTLKVFWGRWASGSFTDVGNVIALSNAQQAHLLYAPLTPAETIAAKSGSLMLQSTLPGGFGTTPTNNFGATPMSGALPTIMVDFTGRSVAISSSFVHFANVGVGDQQWSFGPGSGTLTIQSGGVFFRVEGTGSCFSSGTACNGSASALAKGRVAGIFIGPGGDHAGVAISGAAGASQFSTVRVYCPTC